MDQHKRTDEPPSLVRPSDHDAPPPLVPPVVRPLPSGEDKGRLIVTVKRVEESLGGEFMKGLSQLQTSFVLPERCRDLTKRLHFWRDEVETLFSNRPGKHPENINKTPEASEVNVGSNRRPDSATWLFRRSLRIRSGHIVGSPDLSRSPRRITTKGRNVGTRPVLVFGSPVDTQSSEKFASLCKDLADSLHKFSFAIYYITDFQRTRCTDTVREVIRTLYEIHKILCDEMKRSAADHDPTNDLTRDIQQFLSSRLDVCELQFSELTGSIKDYQDFEIAKVKNKQKRDFEGISNVTQVSTFFAAVVASTLQFSLPNNGNLSSKVLNALWLASLVLTVGAALNSFLAVQTLKIVSSIPISKRPFYVTFWIQRNHSALLVIAVVAYFVGLGLYVVKSQPTLVAISTLVVGAYCVVGLTIVASRNLEGIVHSWLERPDQMEFHTPMPLVSGQKSEVEDGARSAASASSRDSSPGPSTQWFNFDWDYLFNSLNWSPEDGPIDLEEEPEDEPKEILPHVQASSRQADGHQPVHKVSDSASTTQGAESSKPHEPHNYISNLRKIKRSPQSVVSHRQSARGEVAHMRLSHSGRWLVVCHHKACVVYDLKGEFKPLEMRAGNFGPFFPKAADHAEWAPPSDSNAALPLLLTRTPEEVTLWEMPASLTPDSPHALLTAKHNYILGRSQFKYIKWLTFREFLALSEDDVIYRVDYETKRRRAYRLSLPPKENFHISQIYPLSMDNEMSNGIICLANKDIPLPQNFDNLQTRSDIEPEGPGVDYFLSKLFKKVPDQQKNEGRGRDPRRRGIRFMQESPRTNPKTYLYEVKHRKLLHQNVRNLKFCRDNKFMLVNYEENELGTVAPELWYLDFELDKDLLAHRENGTIVSLPAPTRIDPRTSLRWGQASFAGPLHDVIVCDVGGHIRFYQFERSDNRKSPLQINEITGAGIVNEQDFAEFYHPIFTWGDTAPDPIMAATDLDGAGIIGVWNVPVPIDSQPSTKKEENGTPSHGSPPKGDSAVQGQNTAITEIHAA